MRVSAAVVGTLTLLALTPGMGSSGGNPPGARSTPRLEILGIRVGIAEQEAHRRLRPLGTRREIENEEPEAGGMERELWTLKAGEFRYLALGVEHGKVVALQAYTRPGRRALRYRDVGDLARARRLGYYIYQWTVPARDQDPGLRVEARGTDSEYLGSWSIVRNPARVERATTSYDIPRAGTQSGSDPD